ncbi:MAG: DUF4268 domain-containing protein [Pedobacter sp.]
MLEKQFEDILCRYPALIENDLKFINRQINVGGKFADLLFEDRFGQKLVIELKKGVIKREHIAQLLDYEGHFLAPDNPNVRVMLIGNRVPPNLRKSLDHHGFEWMEIAEVTLKQHLQEANDIELLSYFEDSEETAQLKETKAPIGNSNPSSNNEISSGLTQRSIKQPILTRFWKEFKQHANKVQCPLDFKYDNGKERWTKLRLVKPDPILLLEPVRTKQIILAQIRFIKPETTKIYERFYANNKADIESEIGSRLIWRNESGKAVCTINLEEKFDLEDDKKWEWAFNWIIEKSNLFISVFNPRLPV